MRTPSIVLLIHDLDCVKDPEHIEVLTYEKSMSDPGAPGTSFPIINNQCSAGGFKGTAMALLSVMNGIRNPGVFSDKTIAELRAAEMTLYWDEILDLWSSGMTGGVWGSRTYLVQFPEDPLAIIEAEINDPSQWSHGVLAVLFGNFTGGFPPLIESMAVDPR